MNVPAAERVRVGVLLDPEPDKLAEWLADGAAFDAAGADSLWVDCGPEPALDVAALTAALSVVTYRARLVVAFPVAPADRTVDTVSRLSHGRLVPRTEELDRWERVPVPDGREPWRAALDDAARRGVPGLVVPADPRVLDILRNPDDPGERNDLHLAQG